MASARAWQLIVLTVVLCCVSARSATGQDSLARAKDLYASAEYEQALALLNGVELATGGVEADQYRALCLLAMGRTDDAQQVIQRIVEKNPLFEPSAAQVSPRVQTTFRDVRRRLLPTIVRQTYADAKAAFDAGDMDKAKGRFENVVAQLDALDTLGSKDFGDLRVLSRGFVDLIARTSKPAPPPTPAPAAQALREETAPVVPLVSSVIHTAGEAGITPPVTLSQEMPAWRPTRQDTQVYAAVLSMVIDETGAVSDVSIDGTLRPNYEQALRRAVPTWRFKPATKGGVPVKYRKVVAIRLTTDQTP
jgi:tetratricopeptide (TPR) repeat protein